MKYLPLQAAKKGCGDVGAAPGATWSDVAVISSVDPYCISQTLIADCSFVCSLCIAAAFEKRFNKRLITRIIYPQNSVGEPIVNPFGKYIVKLHFNGVERKVMVDDRLPTHPTTGDLLCSHSISPKPHELWVSLIEKAYMKLHGGYNFPGSNSGIDLFALTGWVPEHVRFVDDAATARSDAQTVDRVWQRLHSAHKFGDCLITVATPGDLSQVAQDTTGLVDGHAYAVLDVVEAGRLRMLRVKNPWARRPWIGRFSSKDQAAWTPGLRKVLGIRPAGQGGEEDFAILERAGIFWIEFNDCRKFFDSFVLSWNPSLFPFRLKLHDSWPVSQGPRKDTYFVGENPQFSLLVDRPGAVASSACRNTKAKPSSSASSLTVSVWILLTRHVTDTRAEEGDQVSPQVAQGPDDSRMLALHCYRGTKVGS
jgi:calpain-7